MLTMIDREWMLRASCREADPGLFYKGNTSEALEFCEFCPVSNPCLRYALSFETEWTCMGVWGGLTADNRKDMIRNGKQSAA